MGWEKRQLGVPLIQTLVVALIAMGAARPVCAQASGYDLCIEYSPARAGTVKPDMGTHRFGPDTVVTLSAQPQPGFQFAYWIGDVSAPKNPSTTVRLDTSKIVVAVFKPIAAEETQPEILVGGGGGGGALVPAKVDLSTPSFSIAGGSGGGVRRVAVPVPVVVTPEPATILLLGLGTLALRRRKRY